MSEYPMITKDDPRHAAAQRVLDAMHEFFKLSPCNGAVRWIEDTNGRVIIFTRGEYRQVLMRSVPDCGAPTLQFEQLEGDDEPEGE